MHLELLQLIPVGLFIAVLVLLGNVAGDPPTKNLTRGELMYPDTEDEEGRR